MRPKHFWHMGYLAQLLAAGTLYSACGPAQEVPAGGNSGDNFQVSTTGEEPAQSAMTVGAVHYKERCARSNEPGQMHCHALVRTDEQGNVTVFSQPSGFAPADLQSAYNIPTSGGQGQTIAIVDAYDDPNAESDLAVYRSQFGLPACTTANGCFSKINQNGAASPLPAGNSSWAGEISLDLDMASAACPTCQIMLVEANSNDNSDLYAAELTAVNHGAAVVSNSWGGSEYSGESSIDSQYFNHPGVAIFASTGDYGFGVEYPSTSQYVTAVGGTSLTKASNSRGWSESAWASGGAGCSQYISKPSWQKDTGCGKRTVADVAAVANPGTGVAVYDTYGSSGWVVYGGTSVASPLVASIYAVTGNSTADDSLSYLEPEAFFDVITGSDGSCGGSYLCTAGPGYDGPTGNGTPNGTALRFQDLFFYNVNTGTGATGQLNTSGALTTLWESGGFSAWTHIASAGDDRLFFYNANTGAASTGQLAASGALTTLWESGGFSAWTHIASAGNGRLFFYNANTGTASTGQVSASGALTTLWESGGFSSWTHVVSAGNSRLFFYNANTGTASTGRLNASGAFTTLWTDSSFSPWTLIASAGNGRLFFYNANSGTGATGQVSASGAFTTLWTAGGFSPWTLVASAGNGTLFLYNAKTGTGATGQLAASGAFATLWESGGLTAWTNIVGP